MAATISSIDMYNLLREKIGDSQAKTLTDYVEQRVESSLEKEKGHLATKQDLAEVKADVIKWMFLFWLASTFTTLGGLVAIVKLMVIK